MAEERVQRRLAAILAADVVGFSRLMEADEEGTLARLKMLRADVIDPKIEEYRGRLFKTTGDGVLVEFASAVDATQHAVAVQRALAKQNEDVPTERRIELRIGINVGDIIVEGNDIYGDGVNIAARLEGLADPGCICISGTVFDQIGKKLDLSYDDIGQQTVKNIAEPVHVYRLTLDAPRIHSEVSTSSDAIFRRPAVAVLPFQNMSGDPEQEYFADGLTEDIITALSLWRSFPVIARNSTFGYKGTSPDIRKVGEELGARYVIEGSVRKAGNRVRVNCQLIDAETGHHVWAERLDRELEDIFDVQDEITARIAGTVSPELERAEAVRSARRPESIDAWEIVQRGFSYLDEVTFEGNAKAREMFERAIRIDPTYSRAFIGLAYSHHRDISLGSSESREEKLQKMLDAARRAVQLDEMDSASHLALGLAYNFLNQHEQSHLEIAKAVSLNPIHWVAQRGLGQTLTLSGRPDEAIPYLEKSFQLNPQDPRNHFLYRFMAWAHFTAHRYEEASDWARKAIQQRSQIPESHILLAASLGYLGRIQEAKVELDTCESLNPGCAKPENWVVRYTSNSDNEHLLEGLRKAGLPE